MAKIDFKKIDTYRKTFDGILQVKKHVVSEEALPSSGAQNGDIYTVGDSNTLYMFNNGEWGTLGSSEGYGTLPVIHATSLPVTIEGTTIKTDFTSEEIIAMGFTPEELHAAALGQRIGIYLQGSGDSNRSHYIPFTLASHDRQSNIDVIIIEILDAWSIGGAYTYTRLFVNISNSDGVLSSRALKYTMSMTGGRK